MAVHFDLTLDVAVTIGDIGRGVPECREVAMRVGRQGSRAVTVALLIGGAAAHGQISDAPKIADATAGPCHMTVSGGGSSFLVEVTGLQPNEPIRVTSNSEGEVGKWGTKADADGDYATIVIPLVVGKSSGTATIEVVGQRCRIAASYPWRE